MSPAAVGLPCHTVTTTPGTITHGKQITAADVGPRVPLNTLTTMSSGSITAGATYNRVRVTGNVDLPGNVTFIDSWIEGSFFTRFHQADLQWCKMGGVSQIDASAIGPGSFSLLRCDISMFSDGPRGGSGSISVIECWIHAPYLAVGAHGDGIQWQGNGSTVVNDHILRNRIEFELATTSNVFAADNWLGEIEMRDNYHDGGNIVLRFHESGNYRITGNRVKNNSWGASLPLGSNGGALNTQNAPASKFLEWANNVIDETNAPLGPPP